MDESTGALADSPAASDPSATPSPDAPVPAQADNGQQPDAQVPFHKHPRFQQLTTENRTLKTQFAELQRRLQEFEARARPAAPPSDEDKELLEAGNALERILAAHPKLKGLLGAADQLPTLLEGHQRLQKLQTEGLQRQGRQQISALTKAANLPTEGEDGKAVLQYIEDLVAAEILRTQDGRQRYQSGDPDVIAEAFEAVKTRFLGRLTRDATAATLATKAKTRALPPRPSGGPAGPAGPPTLKPNATEAEVRDFEAGMNERAANLIRAARERLTG